MRQIIIYTLLLLAALSAGSCDTPQRDFAHPEVNSVYYWKTVFDLDSAHYDYLHRHQVGRIYLRMFDVAVSDEAFNGDRTVPNASVRIAQFDCSEQQQIGDIAIVPTVYITLEALKEARNNEGRLARNIVTRVKNMCSYNNVPNVEGLQLDCDWTGSTQGSFFALCDSVRECIEHYDLPWSLSSTIRLHQLSGDVPPVDYGVLMVYNTGNFNDINAENSIISMADVQPYLKHLGGYPLHLDVAYPTYSWQLLYHKNKFAGLMNGIDPTDTTTFEPMEKNRYRVVRDFPYGKRIIRTGDIIRAETSAFSEIAEVKAAIEAILGDTPHSNVLYHFDLNNLSQYNEHEIQGLFSTGNRH